MKIILILSMLMVSGCITDHSIENRCLDANLKVRSLVIEDITNGTLHSKVICSSGEN